VTAGHILRQWTQLQAEVLQVKGDSASRDAIQNDASLDRHEKKRRLAALPKIGPDTTENCSAWWGRDGLIVKDYAYITPSVPLWGELADIGVGRFEQFDPSSVLNYPKFKQDTPDIDTSAAGTSLCKLGFPFNAASPNWNGTAFELAPIPFTRFPIEGMFTRTCQIQWQDPSGAAIQTSFPFKYIETSTPGLKGQSGGPTFDVNGASALPIA
jgi:hypothetical protein